MRGDRTVFRVVACESGAECVLRVEGTSKVVNFTDVSGAAPHATRVWLTETDLYVLRSEVPAAVAECENFNLGYGAELRVMLQTLDDPRDPPAEQLADAALLLINQHGEIPDARDVVSFPADTREIIQLNMGAIGKIAIVPVVLARMTPVIDTPMSDLAAFEAAMAQYARAVRANLVAYAEQHDAATDFQMAVLRDTRRRWFRQSRSRDFVVRRYTADGMEEPFMYPKTMLNAVICPTGLRLSTGESIIPRGADLTEWPAFVAFMRARYPTRRFALDGFCRPKVVEFTNRDLYEWLYGVGCRVFVVADISCAQIANNETSANRRRLASELSRFLDFRPLAGVASPQSASASASTTALLFPRRGGRETNARPKKRCLTRRRNFR